MVVLFDTSAIAKRYRDEAGRETVLHWLGRAQDVVMAAHCKVEVAASLCRDMRDGLTSADDFSNDMTLLERDFDDFSVIGIDRRIEKLAIEAMAGSRLRAMEALHIATALAARVDVFVTADEAQARVARSLNLTTELVESGP